MPDWKLLFPLIHGIGTQDGQVEQHFVDEILTATKQYCKPSLVAQHLITIRPQWDGTYLKEKYAWFSMLLYDEAQSRMHDSNLAPWLPPDGSFPGDKDLRNSIRDAAEERASGELSHATGQLIGAALNAPLGNTEAFLRTVGKAVPWSDIYARGRDFQANTLSDIIMYIAEGPRSEIIKALLRGANEQLYDAHGNYRFDADTELYGLFSGHSLGTVIAYDFVRAIAKWRREADAQGAKRETTEFNSRLLGNQWPVARQILERVQVLGMITFGSPISFFLFRKPELIGSPELWADLCPQPFQAYFGQPTADGPPPLVWQWQNLWHPSDFVAHRCEPYFNWGLPVNQPGALKFVEDIQVPGRYEHGVAAHASYWHSGATDDPASGLKTIEVIARRLASLLIALDQQHPSAAGEGPPPAPAGVPPEGR